MNENTDPENREARLMRFQRQAEKQSPRSRRITTVSRCVRVLNLFGLLIGIPYTLTVYFGWLPHLPGHSKILISDHQLYASASEIPTNVLSLALVRLGLGAFLALVMNNLFKLYEHGIFFSARNVNYFRFLGYYLIIDWIVLYQLESLSLKMSLSTTQLFIGFMVIFISWIMDEGRKIQEEQELTV